ncbi:E3 ubiquitin-protein ligase sina-like [Centruroides vittatus]|uniref:E3 ubiquitin-protein ligase sina-like n=1 Tax=Centruroides vittatus TaxID=120091 RepID=UPI00350FC7F2
METSNSEQAPLQESPPNPVLVSLFECPVCYDYMEPPTFQCPAGHTICSRCTLCVRQCPVCRGELRNYRNLTLERLAEIVALPRVYRGNGCPKKGLVSESIARNPALHGKTHLHRSHKSRCCQVSSHRVGRNPRMDLHCHRQDFIVQVFKTEFIDENSPLYIIIQNVGNRQESGRFLRKIEIRGGDKTILWESNPQSVTDNLKAILRMRDSSTLSIKLLERMLEDHILMVIVTIYPVETQGVRERPEPDRTA